jgi:transcriptional regulator with XRE-family HTH domain
MIGGVSDLDTLCHRLKELRARHGLTQEEFAQAAGMSYKHYQMIESGRKKEIWLSTVARLAAPYGLEAWQLIGAELPDDTKAPETVPSSKVHYRGRK